MSNIDKAFSGGKAFIAFLTGGDPSMESSREFILRMARAGADLIEIGVPFSDPIAEGPVIQAANIRALGNGASVEGLFALVKAVRLETDVPLVFLSYFNPVFRFGCERFFARCKAVGVDGIIIPDLPFEEADEVRPAARANGVDVISLVAPTSQARIKEIARNADGFLYIVSSLGVTGVRSEITTDVRGIVETAKECAPALPCAVGFGINTPAQAAEIARHADGVIVGSAIVKIIAEHGAGAGERLSAYVREMKAAIRQLAL
ncbi:MAG: tryptophan synthase subunit alpha [Spirochaetaceae bacterium]|jgi:tryptophan synthase alpha chain|nr:tryptophan synthase subunit alpha [Spirochaetaceae bacterium]